MNPPVCLSCHLPRQNQSGSSPPFSFFDQSCCCKPIVQRAYKNIISVHASQILHWSLENLPQTQAGWRLQISAATILNTLVSTWTTNHFQNNETVITNPSRHHPRHFVPSAFVNTNMMFLSLYEYWLFLYFISTYGIDVKSSNSVS